MDTETRHQKALRLNGLATNILELSSVCAESQELKTAYKDVFGKSVYFPEDQYSKVLKLRTFIDDLSKEDNIVANLVTIASFYFF